MFKNTSEYAYLYTLCELHHLLLDMLNDDEFTKDQLDRLLPEINFANEVLNADRESLNEYALNSIKER